MNFEFLLAPWQELYFQRTFFFGLMLVCMAGPIGCLVSVSKQTSLANLIVHSVLVGGFVGLLVVKSFQLTGALGGVGLIFSCVVTVVVVGALQLLKSTRAIDRESLITSLVIGLLGCVLFGGIYFQHQLRVDVVSLFLGNIFRCTENDLWFTGLSAVVVCSLIVMFFRSFQLSILDSKMAVSLGISVWIYNSLILATTTVVALSGVSVAGSVVVLTLLIVPQATARMMSKKLWKIMLLSIFFGGISLVLGLYLSIWLNTTSLGTITGVCLLFLVLAIILAPQGILRSWRQKRAIVPPPVLENILVALYRNGYFAKHSFVLRAVAENEKVIVAGIRRMMRDGLLTADISGYSLTEKGKELGEALENAGKLWDLYLIHIGLDEEGALEHLGKRNFVHSCGFQTYLAKKLGVLEEKSSKKRKV